jgi:hypothetical protein
LENDMPDVDLPAQPDVDEAPGWVVRDPGGNIVATGPLTEALPVTGAGETAPEGNQ